MKIINTAKMPQPAGHYSTVIEHNGILYISGQLPLDSITRKKPETFQEEALLVFNKLDTILRTTFNMRRKTLRNALRALQLPERPLLSKRAEQLGVAEFTELTILWKDNGYLGA